MTSAWVVPTLDPGEDRQTCLCLCLPTAPGNQLALQAGKETLSLGVVIGIAQKELGATIGTQQSAISRLEDPEYGSHSLETLLDVAKAFDCALLVKFFRTLSWLWIVKTCRNGINSLPPILLS